MTSVIKVTLNIPRPTTLQVEYIYTKSEVEGELDTIEIEDIVHKNGVSVLFVLANRVIDEIKRLIYLKETAHDSRLDN